MKRFIKTINMFLLVISLILSNVIFYNKNINIEHLKKIYNNMISFVNMGIKESAVSNSTNFINIEGYKYCNNNYQIYCASKGTIIHKNENTLIIKNQYNIYQCFSNVFNVLVNKGDVVDSSYPLAYFEEYFIFYFLIDGECISYENFYKSD